MKCKSLFSLKNKKKYFSVSSTEFVQKVVKQVNVVLNMIRRILPFVHLAELPLLPCYTNMYSFKNIFFF